ncbi:uncharacterized protein ACA1_389530 [Acanthamoeba castellanii str. Neff]|uniref:Inosine/uridine-preferring nucleoside hydrolase domain-containing protein n=1 Tax=Acanthamoeba castellanii (strain ATCC 30010 / Neff) TaxID=1257118 RepID=L8GDX8_ACACF|nr:uncharacterized protein ACA1_389530 [Acanthamoeba castellanii str. Neff]ELR11232.1 hypothetical protein ACA1_389530 [Acanthamoeba castellanii str. Neff]
MGQNSSKKGKGGGQGGGVSGDGHVYRHAHRKMPYRTERLEVSPAAKEAASAEVQENEGPVRVIFDTDIGTDVDDALALLMLLHLPKEDVELLGITTTYGYTQVRARVAQEIVTAYERGQSTRVPDEVGEVEKNESKSEKNEHEDDEAEAGEEAKEHQPKPPSDPPRIPVIAGHGVELGTHRDVWHTGTEGMGLFPLDEIDQMMAAQKKECGDKKAAKKGNAARFIASTVVVIGLGALTNIAEALALDPGIATNMRLVYMGMGHRMKEAQTEDFPFKSPTDPFEPGHGQFPPPRSSCAGLRIDVINDAVTNKLWWTGDPCLALMHATAPPESEVVGRLLKTWLYYRSGIFFRDVRGTCPHDALTVAEAIYPDRFVKYARGHLMIHEWAGFSTFVLDEAGPHRIGVTVAAEEFLEFLSAALTQDLVSRPHDQIDALEEGRMLEEVKLRSFATAPPESEVVGRLLKTWLYYRSGIFFRDVRGTCPHDALTVAEAIYPDRFVKYARGHLMIHEWAGFSTFVLDEAGPHRIGVTVAAEEFLEFLSAALTQDLVSRPHDQIDALEEGRMLEEVKLRSFVFAG